MNPRELLNIQEIKKHRIQQQKVNILQPRILQKDMRDKINMIHQQRAASIRQQGLPKNNNKSLSWSDPKVYEDLSIMNLINKTPNDVYISLATIPPRLISDEFENVIKNLFEQHVKPKNVIVNICDVYKREFQIESNVIKDKISYLKSKYNNLIFNVSVDYGPITKIIGLTHLNDLKINDDDIIIVIDDDWKMKPHMTFYYRYMYQLYNCDCIFINEQEIIDQPNGKFIDNNVLFYDNYSNFVYGWLSFSFKFKYVAKLLDFYKTNIDQDDWLWKHDDLIITLFYKTAKLNACGMNMYFNNSFITDRLAIEENSALRMESDTYDKRLNLERKMLDLFNYPYQFKGVNLCIRPIENNSKKILLYTVNKRDYLFNIKNVTYDPKSNDFYNKQLDFKFLDKNIVVLTITYFNKSDTNVNYYVGHIKKQFTVNENEFIKKQTFFMYTDDVFIETQTIKNYKIIQTFEENNVSYNNFLSINTILSYLPDIEYVFFNDQRRREYILEHFSKYLEYYDVLIPGAYRADLFRALYLYKEGGVYMDCKNILYCNINLLETNDEIYCKDIAPGYVCNGFIFIKNTNNSVMKRYIDNMISNISNKIYGENALCITGPKVLGNIVYGNLHLENNVNGDDWKNSYLTYTSNKNIIIKNSYCNYYDENDYINKLHYSVLWEKRTVYQ
jgi:mannosyltransferase OCH1-like enzyme